MVIICNHCGEQIFLSLKKRDSLLVGYGIQLASGKISNSTASYMVDRTVCTSDNSDSMKNTGNWVGRLKSWLGKGNYKSPWWVFDKNKGLICPTCRRKVRITPSNVSAYRRGDFKRFGIFWTYFCENCRQIVQPIPYRVDDISGSFDKTKYIIRACPICNKEDLSAEFIPNYLGGYDNVGLSKVDIVAKNSFLLMNNLLILCCEEVRHFSNNDRPLIGNLRSVIINEALSSKGELSLSKVQANWKNLSENFERLRIRFEDINHNLNFISPEGIEESRKQWKDLINEMSTIQCPV